jgi:hypothetical protein
MIATIESATTNGFKYGATGMLNTDWGDLGHWQYLPVSYAGYTVGGALSWNSKSSKNLPLSSFLNSYIFKDKSAVMGDLVLDLGRYSRYEEIPVPNMTTTLMAFQFGMRDKIMISEIINKMITGITDIMGGVAPELITVFNENYNNRHPFDYEGMKKFIDSKEAMFSKVRMQSSDSTLIIEEYLNSIKIIRMGVSLQYYIKNRANLSIDEEKSQLQTMRELGNSYLSENKRLWLIRDKPGGYDRSTASLNNLLNQIDNRLILLDKSSFERGINRFFEKAGTAGAVMYIITKK